MPLKICLFKDKFIDEICKESMDDLNEFYEINWVHHLPVPIIVKDRKAIDLLRREKTGPWLVGWAEGNKVFILDRGNFEEESDHEYSPEKYYALLKHEISHAFYRVLSEGHAKPVWLWEGVAIYTSGQNKMKRRPEIFKDFLGFYEKGGKGVYAESGFAVQLLVEKFGKQKLLDLIKRLKETKNERGFNELFRKIYGFSAKYEDFNKLNEL